MFYKTFVAGFFTTPMNCEPIETKNAHDPDEGGDEEEDGKKEGLNDFNRVWGYIIL